MTRASDAFLTGGSGLVGGHLLSKLVDMGWRVDALVRSPEASVKVSDMGATAFRGDLFDVDALAGAMRGARIVFHVAGVNNTCPRNSGPMDRVNITGTRAVVAAAADAGVERVVYTSSAATIGESAGVVANEATRHSGTYLSPYARSKHLAERAAFAEARIRGVDLVAVNPSSVQGPGRATGSAEILIRILAARRPFLVDTDVSIVDIEDCTLGHIAAVDNGVPGERYLLSSTAVSVAEAVSAAASIAGRRIEPRWISAGVVRAVGVPLAWVASMARPDMGFCPALVRTLLHGHRFDASKATEELGVTFRPAVETFSRTVEWLAAEGYV